MLAKQKYKHDMNQTTKDSGLIYYADNKEL